MKFVKLESRGETCKEADLRKIEAQFGERLPIILRENFLTLGACSIKPMVISALNHSAGGVIFERSFDLLLGKSEKWLLDVEGVIQSIRRDWGYRNRVLPFYLLNDEYLVVDFDDNAAVKFVYAPEDSDDYEDNSFTIAADFDDFMSKINPLPFKN